MKYEFGDAIMLCWNGNRADRTGDDFQARFTFCSIAAIVKIRSGSAGFIHPSSDVLGRSYSHR